MASELCMNCFHVKGQYMVCPQCGYVEGTPPEQPHYLTPGTILNNHFIVGPAIGFGGFGITYRCFDTTLGVVVAIKEFYPVGLVNRAPGECTVGLLSGDKQDMYREQLDRFLLEAQSVARFGKAKDIVNVYDYFPENGTAYIVMEYIDGVLLKDYLDKQGSMESDVAMSVIMPIIEAVKKIHSKGIIHRDLSPDNIFITNENSIKIFDFGAAQLNDSKEGMAGEKVIKVGYSAPEQYRDKAGQGFYTDIYSVGAILYQLLTGTKPIESTEREYKDRLKSPMELGVNIKSNLDRAVMEAMAVDPELRFQSIQHFEDALRNKRMAEYPKTKIKRRKRKRAAFIAAAILIILAVGATVGGIKMIKERQGKLANYALDKDTVTVWVNNAEQQEDLTKIAIDSGFQVEGSEQSKPNTLNGKVTVEIQVKDDMETALKSSQPDMFVTDYVKNLDAYQLMSYDGSLLEQSINKKDYYFMSEYENQFPDQTEMPTGLDTLVMYSFYGYDPCMNKTLEDSKYWKEKDKKGAHIKDITQLYSIENGNYEVQRKYQDSDKGYTVLNSGYAAFYGDSVIYAMMLQNSKWKSYFCDKENQGFNHADYMCVDAIQRFNKVARSVDEATGYRYANNNLRTEVSAEVAEETTENIENSEPQNDDSIVCGSNIIASASYKKSIDAIKKEKNPGDNHPTGVTYSIVTCKSNQSSELNTTESADKSELDQNMIVAFADRYAIVDKITENKKNACQKLLLCMLGEAGQKMHSASMKIRVIDDEELNVIEESFKEMYNNKYNPILVGSQTGRIHQYSSDLGNETDEDEIKNRLRK